VSRRRTDQFSIVASPLLVGAITVLIVVVAVFLSYNANQGLPFVPTYDVNVTVPDAAGLVRGNEVRMGGVRVGIVRTIRPVKGPNGHPVGRLALQLDKTIEPIRSDTSLIVRPRSPLGLKYLELTPGRHGKPVPFGGTLPLANAKTPVELTDVLNSLDAPTRSNLQGVLVSLGDGFAGRGVDFNSVIAAAPELTKRARSVMSSLAARSTNLTGLLAAADRTLAEIEPVTPQLTRMITSGATTADALDRARPELGQVVDNLPATEASGTRALRVARPVLQDASGLLRDINRGSPYIVPAASRLHAALQRGIPALRDTTGLAGRLEDTLRAVGKLSRDPSTKPALERLRAALLATAPTLDFIAPLQTRCNYISLWLRNVNSTVSEGDKSGTWFRTLVVGATNEFLAADKPASTLHVNPYPHTAAPGQGGECEAGNEPYLNGQRIGNVPGDQGSKTEGTTRP
jgi:phospholipid/cholesterol/gamma-HCH transport system substrate-binding protein